MPWTKAPKDTRSRLDRLAPTNNSKRLDATSRRHGLMPADTAEVLGNVISGGTIVTPTTFADSEFAIYDDVLPTRIAMFDCGSITSPNTRVVTFQDASGTMPLLESTQDWTGVNTFDPGGGGALNVGTYAAGSNYTRMTKGTGIEINDTSTDLPGIVWKITFVQKGALNPQVGLGGGDLYALVWSDVSGRSVVIDPSLATAAKSTTVKFVQTVNRTVAFPDADGTLLAGSAANLPAAGSLVYGAGATTGMTALAIGASGTILTSTGAAPQWSTNASVVDVARTWSTLQKFPDDKFNIVGSADATKILAFEVDGITAGNTRTLTVQDVNGTLPTIENTNLWTAVQNWQTGNGTNSIVVKNDASAITTKITANEGMESIQLGSRDALGTGFLGVFLPTGTWAADQSYALPNLATAAGTVVCALDGGTFFNVLHDVGTRNKCVTASSGASFEDNTTASKKLRFVLSGAVGNNNIVVSSTAARTYTTPNIDVTFGGLVASTDITAQSAAKAATTLFAVPANGAGVYEVQYVATVTTAATTSCVLGGAAGFQVIFTDPTDSVVKTSAHATVINSTVNATGTTISGVFCARCKASTNLQYAFDYTSVGGTAMQYDLSVRATFIG